MTSRPTCLIDEFAGRIATLDVVGNGPRFQGTIRLEETPAEFLRLFMEFEENVEGQMFNLADDVEDRIAKLPLKAGFANGMEAPVEELQVYPSTGRVSFRLRQTAPVK